jgi:hypothetical protein
LDLRVELIDVSWDLLELVVKLGELKVNRRKLLKGI